MKLNIKTEKRVINLLKLTGLNETGKENGDYYLFRGIVYLVCSLHIEKISVVYYNFH